MSRTVTGMMPRAPLPTGRYLLRLAILLVSSLILSPSACHAASEVPNTAFDAAQSALLTKDYSRARKLLAPPAEGGHGRAQYLLGMLYLRGQGGERDFSVAARWFEQSMATGEPRAAYELARLYETGRGVTQDLDKSLALYRHAGDDGFTRAANAIDRVSAKIAADSSVKGVDIYKLIRFNREDELASQLNRHPELVHGAPDNQESLLKFSIDHGSEGTTRLLLAAGSDPNEVSRQGVPLLVVAAEKGDPGSLALLLEAGANIDATDPLGNTSLHRAAARGELEAVDLLLRSGAAVDVANLSGDYPLDVVDPKRQEVAALLRQNGARSRFSQPRQQSQPDSLGSGGMATDAASPVEGALYTGWPLLNVAAWRGDIDAVNSLLEEGKPVDSVDSGGYTPLARAARQGNKEVAKLLLAVGASSDTALADGSTPLDIAVSQNHPAIVSLLLSSRSYKKDTPEKIGRLVNAAIDNGNEAMALQLLAAVPVQPGSVPASQLLIAASRSGFRELVSTLLETGVDPNSIDAKGCTPLWWSAFRQHRDLVTLLLDHGADAVRADMTGNSPLHVAAKSGDLATLETLASHYPDLNPVDSLQTTPLMLAAVEGQVDTVAWLLQRGADVRLRDNHSNTALMLAAQRNRLDVVKLLIGAGASPGRRNSDGLTVLEIAQQAGSDDVYQYLKKQRSDTALWK